MSQMYINYPEVLKKWKTVLENDQFSPIKDQHRKKVTAQLLENTQKEAINSSAHTNLLMEDAPANAVGSYGDTGGIAKFDPVLIHLVRRSMPQLIAFDVCGVQPMTQPTGLIFAMKSRYTSQGGTEALFNEADTDFSGTGTHAGSNPVNGTYTTGTGMTTAAGEALGSSGGGTFQEMAFTIEKKSVTAKTRALKAEYTHEIAQDLKSVHGLEAEQELANILNAELLTEINREVIRTIYTSAEAGAENTTVAGTFDLDVDSNGRWMVERFKGLMFQLDRDANRVAQRTRRGKANWVICSSDVASALAAAGRLQYTPSVSTDLTVDEASTTFAGVLDGKYKVFVDPYSANAATHHFYVVGYKGASPYDAGLYYCPYVPLIPMRATDPATFQPKIAFKTRYGLVANPFTSLDANGDGLGAGNNYYFRRVIVDNLL